MRASELRELEIRRVREVEEAIARRRESRLERRPGSRRRGWDEQALKNEIVREFRALGACVVREERSR